MSRWKLAVREYNGRAVMSLLDNGQAVGACSVSINDYAALNRALMSEFVAMAKTSLRESLQNKLWQDAQRVCGENVDAAKRRLIEFGWSTETIDTFVNEMVLSLAGDMLNTLPDHVR